MPITTVRCPKCGARINKSVSDGQIKSDFEKEYGYSDKDNKREDLVEFYYLEVQCPRCKHKFELDYSDVDQRTIDSINTYKEDILNLDNNDRFEEFVCDDNGDSVEEAIQSAINEFKQAADEFDSEVDTDIPQIDFEKTIPDEKIDELMSTFSSKIRSKIKSDSEIVDAAFEFAEKNSTERVKNVLNQLNSSDEDVSGRRSFSDWRGEF